MEALQRTHGWFRDEPISKTSSSTETLIKELVAIDNNHFDNNSDNTVLVANTQEDHFSGNGPSHYKRDIHIYQTTFR